MHRFFIKSIIKKTKQVIIPENLRHQLINVLRLSVGDKITLFDNSGWEYITELKEIKKDNLIGFIIEKQKNSSEPTIKITLYQPILKSDKFEFILQKGTELGVTNFVPIFCDRSIKRWNDDQILTKKYPRWKKIITEASEQCQRGIIPELNKPLDFTKAITYPNKNMSKFIALTGNKNSKLKQIPQSNINMEIGLFTGPEGGFTKEEIELSKANSIKPISLGNRILRAETATIILITAILIKFDEI
ncbi:MAG: 16S rRNA (uracil(1498)-N(3))-methyltransferase [Chloroflexi bacterium]|jgi:16S rRNA (uracil1498-N3)-methyltransferase|nr:16S rRNA (uracil(1498)-N(3))-methyltransferase [Chloroflexota bacterium]MCH2304342.1 16S rRNA (uracil(1498)-N(3))-methyltransferase [SAR202 cluster bacterium]|tara:strand:+ start:30413 stop:31150 length:738 start_codon:yes stop_codon:yes gene_type:complete